MNLNYIIYLSALALIIAVSFFFASTYYWSKLKKNKNQKKDINATIRGRKINRIAHHLSRKKILGGSFADTIELKKKRAQKAKNEKSKFRNTNNISNKKPRITIVNDNPELNKNMPDTGKISGQSYDFKK